MFLDTPKCSWILPNAPGYSKTLLDTPKRSWMLPNTLHLPKCSWILPNAPESAQMLLDTPKCSLMLPNAPEYSHMLLDTPKCSWILKNAAGYSKTRICRRAHGIMCAGDHWVGSTPACAGRTGGVRARSAQTGFRYLRHPPPIKIGFRQVGGFSPGMTLRPLKEPKVNSP